MVGCGADEGVVFSCLVISTIRLWFVDLHDTHLITNPQVSVCQPVVLFGQDGEYWTKHMRGTAGELRKPFGGELDGLSKISTGLFQVDA